jgi:hypothetical protein
MHDYHPLIARAVSRLESNAPAARRAVFQQVRIILLDQLLRRQPPASESEIARECAALEDAIRKVEAESPKPAVPPTVSAQASPNKQTRSGRPFGISDRRPMANGSSRGPVTGSRHHAFKPTKTADGHNSRLLHLRALKQYAQRLRSLLNWMLAMLVQLRRAQWLLSGSKTVRGEAFDKVANPQSNLDSLATKRADGSNPANVRQANGTAKVQASANDRIGRENASVVSNLLEFHYLDQMMLDAAHPLAPYSVRQDARIVLKWLNIANAEAIKTEHYDQFASAFQRYTIEWETPSVGFVPATAHSPLALNDDIRGAFNRMLEREKDARIFDKALWWFANVWIGLVVLVNVIAIGVVVAGAPTLWAGIASLAENYSPFNVTNWVVQLLALSPGLVAITWLHRRLNHPWGVAGAVPVATRIHGTIKTSPVDALSF